MSCGQLALNKAVIVYDNYLEALILIYKNRIKNVTKE